MRLVLYSTKHATQRLNFFISLWISGYAAGKKIAEADWPRKAPGVFSLYSLIQGPFNKIR
jgi:hypothetical protein